MILDIVKAFCDIIDFSFKLKDRLLPEVDQQSISHLLLAISNLLLYVSTELEQGRYPHSQCGEMWGYMKAFQNKLENKITQQELVELSNLIEKCYQVEQLLGQLNSLQDTDKVLNLNKLKEASGQFKAASELIKIK